ncbi:putative transcription factor bHLH family [Rosa chinensis]|uniref:Putative transcription factor bHLH family n=1 Tax=Rosa chinensis TaxID=74649 RepID=A0A2P6Q481_ROSCH|nr:transcription factor bHLH162 [Rosa chinensis]XP_040362826.1 transcription factor bHLH162 [Rosa chinensis]PRQ28954.1 putative transcription factor bHLH family [Rosa chinensis]
MDQQQYPSSSSSRTDRKTIEKNRRNQMKALYSELNSLLPHQRSREVTSLPDQIDEAVNYIKKLQTNLEKMREKKDSQMGVERITINNNGGSRRGVNGGGLRLPQIEIREMGSVLDVVLITGLDFQFMFEGSIRMLLEEGADIVNASFSVVEDTIFHTIHSKIGESAPGPVAARISDRLRKFVNEASTTAF